jgi:hypothetical protein
LAQLEELEAFVFALNDNTGGRDQEQILALKLER